MIILFWPIIGLIALFESHLDARKNKYMRSFFGMAQDDGEEDDPAVQNPSVSSEEDGDMEISRVPFDTLVKAFPNSYQVCGWLSAFEPRQGC